MTGPSAEHAQSTGDALLNAIDESLKDTKDPARILALAQAYAAIIGSGTTGGDRHGVAV